MVTINSSYMKLRARGGDNFILSPLYCGNAVTGWRGTKEYMDGEMSLATAMAISGAAADPHGAPGGEGLTRNRSLSLLMALLNPRSDIDMRRMPQSLGPSDIPKNHASPAR